jgi:uncharacterized protein (UPF0335 family)
MAYTNSLDSVINQVIQICNDGDTYAYHRSFGYSIRIQEKLGSGAVLQAIGLFTAIGFLAKIHYILQYGFEMKDYTDEYKEFVKELKSKGISTKLIDRYVKKKSKVEINETDAFVRLIKDYPDSFGLENLTDDGLRTLWNEYRNHLVHTLFIGNESLIIESIISNLNHPLTSSIPDVNNFQEDRYKKKPQKHSFTFIENKETLRGTIIANLLKDGLPIDMELVIRASHDEIKIDNLNIDVRNMANWIIERYRKEEFPIDNVKQLDEWLQEVGIRRSIKVKFPKDFDISKLKK